MPVLLAGDSKKDASERKLCSLYLSIMDRMEVKLEQLGAARSLVGL